MAATAASAVLAAAKILYATVQQVKANKRQARLLAERVQAVVEPVHAFNDARLAQPEMDTALAQLLAVIHDAATFVDDFGDMGRLKRTVFKAGHTERFAELNTRLSHAAQALTLGAVLQLHFSAADDLRAQTSDRVADKEVLGVWAIAPTLAEFVGRESELAELEARLHPPASARSPATRIAISGMGGTGKSTLAQRAAALFEDRFTSGWVVDGSKLASLQAGLRLVAASLELETVNLDQVARVVRARLGQPDCAGWLLIVDNVDDLGFAHELPGLLPNLGGCLVVTSRLAHWDREDWATIGLAAMPVSEGVQVLGDAGKSKGEAAEAAALREVAAMLGGLPLALTQARMVVRRARIGWSTYLDRLRSQRAAALGDSLPSLQLSLHAALLEQPACGVVFELLQALHPDDVPRTILADALGRAVGTGEWAAGADAEAVLVLLADRSIVQLADASVSVHRLMREAMQIVRPVQRSTLLALNHTMNAATSMRAGGTMDPQPHTSALLALHYPVLLENLEAVVPGSLEVADAFFGYVQAFILTNGGPSLALAQRCVPLYDPHFDDSDPRKATVMFIISVSLCWCGAYKDGMALAERALAAAQRWYPAQTVLVGCAHMALGNAHIYMGSYADALRAFETGRAVYTGALGADHPVDNAWGYFVGWAASAMGAYDRQLQLCQAVLPGLLRHYPAKTTYPLLAQLGVGEAVCERGDPQRGLVLMQETVAALDEVFGASSYIANMARLALAKAYGRCGSLDRQREVLQHAYAFYVASPEFGAAHPATAQCRTRLADAYGICGDAAMQLKLGRETLPHLDAFFPTGHIELARAHVCIGEAVSEPPSAGLALLEQGLAVIEVYFGPDHVETARVRTRLARVLVKKGDAVAAQSQLERALAAQDAFYKDGHGDVAQTLLVLADVHGTVLGDADGDRACQTRALALFERHYGAEHALTLHVRALLTPTPALAPAPTLPAEPKPTEQWGVADVTVWLRGLDLEYSEQVVQSFQTEGVRGRHLRQLTEERLQAYGVRGGDRLTLLDELKTLLTRA